MNGCDSGKATYQPIHPSTQVSAVPAPGEPMRSSSAVLTVSLAAAILTTAHAQTPSPQPPAQPAYTIQANSRVVLTDVTVTDHNGNPVHGLPKSVFHLFDNKQPQAISSFEEHAGTPPAILLPASAHGIYSNDYLLHLPPVLSVIIIDIANINIPDQMYLNYELTKLLNDQPVTQPLAIYLRAGSGCFLVQNFTSDRTLLLAALHKAIPRIPPTGREYLSDLDTLHQISVALSQYSGRKNVLWFSGGSTLFLRDDALVLRNSAAWRNLYDELEQERIAVYPIDARGLTTYTGPHIWSQHFAMNEVAQATGGQASYDNNGLKEIAAHVLGADGSFYTLTYAPHDFHFDNKWHDVRVAVDGSSYKLSYRTGYFADGSLGTVEHPVKPRTRLLAGGERVDEPPELHSVPIIFQARVLPASDPSLATQPPASATVPPPPPKKGTTPFSIRFSLPAAVFAQQPIDGKQKATFGVAVFAFNRKGTNVAQRAESVSLAINEDSLRQHPDGNILVDQQINLAKGDGYLDLAVWDTATGRLGTLQIALEVPKPPKHEETAQR
jgi:VWFA-related protein